VGMSECINKTDDYQKMAGTAAVFVIADLAAGIPVERDGPRWSAKELHLDQNFDAGEHKSPMASVLALEGLEDYDPPKHGDIRLIQSMDACFIYSQTARAWVQLP